MDSEGQPVSQQSMKKGKNDTNASASPIPREPFDLAQLKAYGIRSFLFCFIFWPRFYIVVLGIAFFPFIYFQYSIWTFIKKIASEIF